ncbi:hypothetical protein I79_020141 [Cricetulus griseus]|uniref:Uncharacterized protein n=1 Tax=Cricetulus griseus TaxID=10029 RepID=G3I9A5_CRIGR|nr:hypothetical protein I79_020141 [Cricetulus griseus]
MAQHRLPGPGCLSGAAKALGCRVPQSTVFCSARRFKNTHHRVSCVRSAEAPRSGLGRRNADDNMVSRQS